jgi:predicted RNase H-like HicB family nuclease
MKKDFNVIIEKDEDGFYIASVPALKGCHTQARSLDILMERIKEAIELCLENQIEPTYPTDFIGVQKITVNEKTNYYSIPKTGKTVAKKGLYKPIKGNLIAKKSTSESLQPRTK